MRTYKRRTITGPLSVPIYGYLWIWVRVCALPVAATCRCPPGPRTNQAVAVVIDFFWSLMVYRKYGLMICDDIWFPYWILIVREFQEETGLVESHLRADVFWVPEMVLDRRPEMSHAATDPVSIEWWRLEKSNSLPKKGGNSSSWQAMVGFINMS